MNQLVKPIFNSYITKNFKWSELLKSQTAVRLGLEGEQYVISIEVYNNLKRLFEEFMQPLRDRLGFPIPLSSVYRSMSLNKKIKGSITSQHCKGQASDIDMDTLDCQYTNADLFNFIKNNFMKIQ